MAGRIVLAGCIVFAVAVPAAAQTDLGIRTGVAANSVSPGYEYFSTRIIAAADVTLPLYGNLGVRLGAAYAPRGGVRWNPNIPDVRSGAGLAGVVLSKSRQEVT